MIIEQSGVQGLKTDLAHLDETAEELGFVRWQWEYRRATYDCKLEDPTGDYFLRINCRAESGKLESPYAILVLEDVYMGKASFPHGMDYNTAIPDHIRQAADAKLSGLKQALVE